MCKDSAETWNNYLGNVTPVSLHTQHVQSRIQRLGAPRRRQRQRKSQRQQRIRQREDELESRILQSRSRLESRLESRLRKRSSNYVGTDNSGSGSGRGTGRGRRRRTRNYEKDWVDESVGLIICRRFLSSVFGLWCFIITLYGLNKNFIDYYDVSTNKLGKYECIVGVLEYDISLKQTGAGSDDSKEGALPDLCVVFYTILRAPLEHLYNYFWQNDDDEKIAIEWSMLLLNVMFFNPVSNYGGFVAIGLCVIYLIIFSICQFDCYIYDRLSLCVWLVLLFQSIDIILNVLVLNTKIEIEQWYLDWLNEFQLVQICLMIAVKLCLF